MSTDFNQTSRTVTVLTDIAQKRDHLNALREEFDRRPLDTTDDRLHQLRRRLDQIREAADAGYPLDHLALCLAAEGFDWIDSLAREAAR